MRLYAAHTCFIWVTHFYLCKTFILKSNFLCETEELKESMKIKKFKIRFSTEHSYNISIGTFP